MIRTSGYSAVFSVLLTCCTTPGTIDSEDAGQTGDAVVADYVAAQFSNDGPGGVVLVARGAKPILHRAYGMADIGHGLKMRVGQALPIGSITKSFTAGAILRLVEEGKIGLDDDVRLYVPDAPVGGRTVTIEQLLTHTSGIPSLVDVDGFFEWAKDQHGTEELLAYTRGLPFLFEPGHGYSYSDTGYILLGAVLESIGQASWDEVIRHEVADRLGLASVESAANAHDLATGYVVSKGSVAPAVMIDWSVPHASGSLVATAEDLLRWVRAWRGNEIVGAPLMKRAWQARELPNGMRSGYGYGWKRCQFEGRTAIQQGGWVPGFTASVLHLPDEDLTAICLTNSEGGIEASYLTRRITRMILTGRPEMDTVELNDARKQALSGRFRSSRGNTWKVSAREKHMFVDLGNGPIALVALSENMLCAADSDGTWCFTFDEESDGKFHSAAMSLTCEPQDYAVRVD